MKTVKLTLYTTEEGKALLEDLKFRRLLTHFMTSVLNRATEQGFQIPVDWQRLRELRQRVKVNIHLAESSSPELLRFLSHNRKRARTILSLLVDEAVKQPERVLFETTQPEQRPASEVEVGERQPEDREIKIDFRTLF